MTNEKNLKTYTKSTPYWSKEPIYLSDRALFSSNTNRSTHVTHVWGLGIPFALAIAERPRLLTQPVS